MQGHAPWVRVSHWIAAVSVTTLAVSGVVILMAHPRLYWGEAGNDLTPALIELPISRNYHHAGFGEPERFFENRPAPVTASRTRDIFNENGWGRSLHFLAAWVLVATGALYAVIGIGANHFGRGFSKYGAAQRWTYLAVVFVGSPLIVLTGLTMSPAVTAAVPGLLAVFGGQQSARTIHFVVFLALVVFAVVHVVKVARSGFRRQMRAMTLGE